MMADSLDELLRTLAEVKRKRLRLDPRERSSKIMPNVARLHPLQKGDELQVLLKRLLTGPQEVHWEQGTRDEEPGHLFNG
jgi:hypothetical protein